MRMKLNRRRADAIRSDASVAPKSGQIDSSFASFSANSRSVQTNLGTDVAHALAAALKKQVAGQQDLIVEQSSQIAKLQAQLARQHEANPQPSPDLSAEPKANNGAGQDTDKTTLHPQGRTLIELEQHIAEQLTRIDELEKRAEAAEAEREESQKQVSALQFKLQLARDELDRSKGQVDFVKDILVQPTNF